MDTKLVIGFAYGMMVFSLLFVAAAFRAGAIPAVIFGIVTLAFANAVRSYRA